LFQSVHEPLREDQSCAIVIDSVVCGGDGLEAVSSDGWMPGIAGEGFLLHPTDELRNSKRINDNVNTFFNILTS
jgi:hypothetical protein